MENGSRFMLTKTQSHFMLKTYTVTATGTYFVQAVNEIEAEQIIHEAMLGIGDTSILGWGEIHYGMKTVEGFHTTIKRED